MKKSIALIASLLNYFFIILVPWINPDFSKDYKTAAFLLGLWMAVAMINMAVAMKNYSKNFHYSSLSGCLGVSWKNADEVNSMRTEILDAGESVKVFYDNQLRSDMQFRFQSSAEVDVYGVSKENFKMFKKNRKVCLFSFIGRTDIKRCISMMPGEGWYFIVENKSDEPVAIHYELFDV